MILRNSSCSLRRFYSHVSSKMDRSTRNILWFDVNEPLNFRTPKSVCEHLSSNILFENEKLIFYDKPAGLPVYSATDKQSKDETSVEEILHLLAFDRGCPSLYISQAPHSSYSGVMLLVKSDEAYDNIAKIFLSARKRNEYLRTDIAVTIGVPTPNSGNIKVAIQHKVVDECQTILPIFNPSTRALKMGTVKRKSTLYRVLDSQNGSGLIELQPRDSLRQLSLLHMTCKMCKVLGDKVFSNRIVTLNGVNMFLKPSEVTPETSYPYHILKKLGIVSKEQLNKLPLHIHRHKLSLPANDALQLETNLIVTSPLPTYFLATLECLGLKYTS